MSTASFYFVLRDHVLLFRCIRFLHLRRAASTFGRLTFTTSISSVLLGVVMLWMRLAFAELAARVRQTVTRPNLAISIVSSDTGIKTALLETGWLGSPWPGKCPTTPHTGSLHQITTCGDGRACVPVISTLFVPESRTTATLGRSPGFAHWGPDRYLVASLSSVCTPWNSLSPTFFTACFTASAQKAVPAFTLRSSVLPSGYVILSLASVR